MGDHRRLDINADRIAALIEQIEMTGRSTIRGTQTEMYAFVYWVNRWRSPGATWHLDLKVGYDEDAELVVVERISPASLPAVLAALRHALTIAKESR